MATLSSKWFSYDPATKNFAAEISTLEGMLQQVNEKAFAGIAPRQAVFERIFDDSCDEGFYLVSVRTGALLKFYVNKTETNDGDIVAWELIPADKRHAGITCTVFND